MRVCVLLFFFWTECVCGLLQCQENNVFRLLRGLSHPEREWRVANATGRSGGDWGSQEVSEFLHLEVKIVCECLNVGRVFVFASWGRWKSALHAHPHNYCLSDRFLGTFCLLSQRIRLRLSALNISLSLVAITLWSRCQCLKAGAKTLCLRNASEHRRHRDKSTCSRSDAEIVIRQWLTSHLK